MTKVICPKCDTRYDETKNFCIKCGTPLIKKDSEGKKEPSFGLESSPLEELSTPDLLHPKRGGKTRIYLAGGAAVVVIAIAIAIFLFIPRLYKKMSSESPLTQEIAELVGKAREYIDADKLTSPPGENAYEVSLEILSKEPGNEEALKIQKEIAARYLMWGDEYYNSEDFEKAISFYRKALSVDKKNIETREKIVRAERMLQEKRIMEETRRRIAEQKRLSELNIYLPLFNSKVIEKAVSLGYHPYRVIFLDNFESNRNEWPVEDVADGPFLEVKNGRLSIEERTEGQAFWISKELEHRDFILRFNIRHDSGADDNGAGIFFRALSFNDDRYFISIDASGDCYYQIGYYDGQNKKWAEIKEWTKTERIRSGEINKIEAVVVENSIHLFINGEFTTSAKGLKNSSGNIFGFFCGTSGTRYSFDDLCFIELRKGS
ncbi:MAG: family 16 glycoside hydrolase [Candidatus Aminicenantales bacterium]